MWKSQPRTLVKHQVYRRYLHCWMGKICQRFLNAAIIDAFAGPGGYTDGPEGSPLVIAKTFLNHSLRSKFNLLRLVCLEKDPQRRNELAARLAALPKALGQDLVGVVGRGGHHVEDLADDAVGLRNAPRPALARRRQTPLIMCSEFDDVTVKARYVGTDVPPSRDGGHRIGALRHELRIEATSVT